MDRRRELDALRGLAALSVLAYHSLANNSALLSAGVGLGEVAPLREWLLVYTPLHVAWLGGEAVWLFFVLSGFVLTRSTSGAGFGWGSYYPGRLVRLYMPAVFAIAFAWGLYAVRRFAEPAPTAIGPTGYPLVSVLHDATLVGGTTPSLGVLWSLQWEVVFSLLLPVYLLLAQRHRLVSALVVFPVMLLGWAYNDPATSFLPMFFVGCLMATSWDAVARRFGFLDGGGRSRNVVGSALIVLAVLALTSFYLVGRPLQAIGLSPRLVTVPVVLAGVALLIVLVQQWPPLRRVVTSRIAVFVGKVSFSLYLVHLPVVLLFIYLWGQGGSAAVAGLLVSPFVAVAFYYAVERPAHRLSRRITAGIREKERSEREAIAVAPASLIIAQAQPGLPQVHPADLGVQDAAVRDPRSR